MDTRLAVKRNGVLVYIFSKELDSALKTELLASSGVNINLALTRHFNQKIWVYDAQSLNLINDAPFSSVKKASQFLNTNAETIKIHLDTQKAVKLRKTYEIFYYFSYELDADLKSQLLQSEALFMFKSYGSKFVWIYDAITLELINGGPFSSRTLACTFLNTNRTTIVKNIDTKKSVKLRNYTTPVYFFSYKLDSKQKLNLSS